MEISERAEHEIVIFRGRAARARTRIGVPNFCPMGRGHRAARSRARLTNL
jgi:hypothetical protein